MLFTIEKIQNQLEEIQQTIYRERKSINTFKYLESECDGAHDPNFNDSNWNDFQLDESWGGYDKTAWFRSTVSIPSEWKDQRVVLRFLVGPRDGGGSTAETLLYVNGKPLQAIDIWHEEAWLPEELVQSGEIHIALKAWSGVLHVPEVRRFKVAELALSDVPTEKYYYLANTLIKTVKELDENDYRREKILQAVNQSIYKIDFLEKGSSAYYDSLKIAHTFLQEQVDKLFEIDNIKPKVVTIGHSHIDMAWLWRLKDTREKASRTFATVLHLMRQYPEYRFLHTSPQLYKFLKQDYPEIYQEVKERIKSGEWEITGGMWIEPDTNLPSGESLVRQLLFGKRFMKEEFDVDSKVVWLPDVFGYSWALPQIMKKSGIEYFMTSKMSWSQYNRFPYDTFNWRGVDGTEMLTHFITTPEHESGPPYTYNGVIEPKSIKGTWDEYQQKEINEELIAAFGWGDGGGGPTKEMIETARVLKNVPGIPKVEMGHAEPYFKRLKETVNGKSIPVWDGELYLEYHRGTYTSQASLKRANRKAEVIYHDAELYNSVADILNKTASYQRETLNRGWEKMLLNQFHDVLPGSSIRQVNEDAREDYEEVQDIGQSVLSNAQQMIVDKIKVEKDSLVVFNSLAHKRDDYIEVTLNDQVTDKTTILNEEGVVVPVQKVGSAHEKKLLVHAAGIPGLGYKTFSLEQSQTPVIITNTLKVQKDYLENEFYKITLHENGQFTSVWDKRVNREVLASSRKANVLQAFEDKPMKFDAWDIDLYYQEKMKEISEVKDIQVVEEGPLRGRLKVTWSFNKSTITQFITLYADSPRIDFETEVDWQEKQVLLKVAFPVNIRSTKATYDIQFGNMERPTHWNTSWDYAKFETVGHKWADLSEGNYGVSLVNDCKYGHDIKDNVLRLTLIKSSIAPDETADRGKHVFTYSLLPHEGDWKQADIVNAAYQLNYPLISKSIQVNQNGTLPAQYEFAKVDTDGIMMETVKKAEDDDAYIVRLYEYKQNRYQNVNLSFGQPLKKAMECNLLEEEEQEMSIQQEKLSFSIAPYEIKSFKVWF
ncbi:alpha-mannosidase [Gracilibacillus salitolerans]|uniref:Alpha-mannosidase n=1 Tax=Gracilibacillus salitolerans TaxID=2663022 RepID=A0A5Q2TG47_9BACI|nr:alpha-mannosidase [Gracilibacillus salitolerans]QGH33636.1 alpha-mannosidase [Gracilibacillus salitolerans]